MQKKEENKVPTSLLFKEINYSDKKVIEKLMLLEKIRKQSVEKNKKITYMNLYI